MNFHILKIACVMLFLSSCIVQSPKYTTLDQVMSLRVGMPQDEVESILGLEPYNVKEHTDTSDVYVYVYRLYDRMTLSFYTKPVNGRKVTGKYVQLFVAYSRDCKVISIETCSLCPDNLMNTSKIDFNKIIAFISVTLPAILLYFGLK